jgi:hypothetical protein
VLDELLLKASPRPWRLSVEQGRPDSWMGPAEPSYCEGILSADDRWVVRFEDDYSTDQWADAELIVALVNATIPEPTRHE